MWLEHDKNIQMQTPRYSTKMLGFKCCRIPVEYASILYLSFMLLLYILLSNVRADSEPTEVNRKLSFDIYVLWNTQLFLEE